MILETLSLLRMEIASKINMNIAEGTERKNV